MTQLPEKNYWTSRLNICLIRSGPKSASVLQDKTLGQYIYIHPIFFGQSSTKTLFSYKRSSQTKFDLFLIRLSNSLITCQWFLPSFLLIYEIHTVCLNGRISFSLKTSNTQWKSRMARDCDGSISPTTVKRSEPLKHCLIPF